MIIDEDELQKCLHSFQNRVVFFTAKQRRKHMSSRFWSWTLALLVLVVAVLINTGN